MIGPDDTSDAIRAIRALALDTPDGIMSVAEVMDAVGLVFITRPVLVSIDDQNYRRLALTCRVGDDWLNIQQTIHRSQLIEAHSSLSVQSYIKRQMKHLLGDSIIEHLEGTHEDKSNAAHSAATDGDIVDAERTEAGPTKPRTLPAPDPEE